MSLVSSSAEGGQEVRSALLVTCSTYQDVGLRTLRTPVANAESLSHVLADPQIGGFDVNVVANAQHHVVARLISEFFANRRLDDLLLLYIAGHGLKDGEGHLYFAATDTQLSNLDATAIAARFVNLHMGESRSRRVVLLLDCCYSEAFARGTLARADRTVYIAEEFGGRGRAVLTASKATEYSFEDGRLVKRDAQRSVFTSMLVRGLATGEADRDGDGLISLDELYEYVYDEVRRKPGRLTPSKWVFGVEGGLYVARSRRRANEQRMEEQKHEAEYVYDPEEEERRRERRREEKQRRRERRREEKQRRRERRRDEEQHRREWRRAAPPGREELNIEDFEFDDDEWEDLIPDYHDRGEFPSSARLPPEFGQLPPERRRVVSTGFAFPSNAADTVNSNSTLQAAQPYLYWFEIGDRPVRDAIDAPRHREVPLERVPAGTPLTVALFAFPGELEISPEADIGEFIIAADGSAQVIRQPLRESPGPPGGARLLFPVRTPQQAGRYRLRCNLYCRQTLLQSRLVEAEVTSRPQTAEQALRSSVDYTVSTTLDPELLGAIQPLRLSMLLNDNGDGTHGFRFLGEDNLKGDAAIDGQTLQDLLDRARSAYRRSAWDSDDEWDAEWKLDRYIYRNPPGPERFSEDLVRMARAGYRLWSRLAVNLSRAVQDQLPPDRSLQRSLREIMRRPGFVEVACKFSARMAVPASILYDYPLDTNKDLRVCPDALDAIAGEADLVTHRCFTGDCAFYDDDSVVCPGGFWGYRHGIGLPQSRAEQADGESATSAVDSWPEIRCIEKPEFIIGVADDFNGDHVRRVRALGDDRSRISSGRDALLADLRAADFAAHVIYFFCHGALVNGIPALLVGPSGSEGITHDNIEDGRMFWGGTHPLVVLNGCSTAAVEPKYALNLVDAFVRGALASGVIGTEITVFESLATLFAEEFFTRFLDYDEPVGEAVRRARLQVLTSGNPLGLVYIVYAAPRLQLIP